MSTNYSAFFICSDFVLNIFLNYIAFQMFICYTINCGLIDNEFLSYLSFFLYCYFFVFIYFVLNIFLNYIAFQMFNCYTINCGLIDNESHSYLDLFLFNNDSKSSEIGL